MVEQVVKEEQKTKQETPIIHIRTVKNTKYYLNDGMRLSVTKTEVVGKKKRDSNEDLA